jgi:hypothetical protein
MENVEQVFSVADRKRTKKIILKDGSHELKH